MELHGLGFLIPAGALPRSYEAPPAPAPVDRFALNQAVGPGAVSYREEVRELKAAAAAHPITRPDVPFDGRGVTIGIIDAYDEATRECFPHARGVEGTAATVAPGANRALYSMIRGGSEGPPLRNDPHQPVLPADLADSPAALDRALLGSEPTVLKALTTRLNQLADDPGRDPSMRVINMSISGTRGHYYEMMQNKLNEREPEGSFRFPNLRQEVLGSQPLEPLEEARKIAAYTDARLDQPGSAYSQSLQNWRDTTARVASPPYNMQLVVAAANLGPVPVRPDAPMANRVLWEEVHPGSLTSDMTLAPEVLSCGAYDAIKGQMWDRTSRAPSPENRVLAPGNGVLHPENASTSAAAPYLSATLALLLEANPSLTPAQLREIVLDTATPLPGVEPRAQGAGLVDVEEAVRRAAGS